MTDKKIPEGIDFDTWLAYGIDNKWALYPTCYIHDGVPTTDEEEEEMEEGGDPCMHVVRVFSSPEEFDEAVIRMRDTLPYRMPGE